MTTALKFAEDLAIQTGELLTTFFQLEGVDAEVKSDRTVVTEADLSADHFVRESIQAAYPNDEVLTEETNSKGIDPGKPLWVIDPLDGTTNFALGLHIWGVSIARIVDGFPETAALYFPLLEELYSAQKGSGAFLNHKPLTVQPLRPNMPTAFFACSSKSLRNYQLNVRYKFRMLGAAAYDFCLVARGGAIAGFHSVAKIWDIAAGWLVVEEAGGVAQLHPSGSPFPYFADHYPHETSFPTFVAADEEIAAKLASAITRR
jgi:myo-inositol-1(or 4)-monophosphatase